MWHAMYAGILLQNKMVSRQVTALFFKYGEYLPEYEAKISIFDRQVVKKICWFELGL